MSNYLEAIKVAFGGAGTTLELTGFAVILGVVLGLLIALLKLSKSRIVGYTFEGWYNSANNRRHPPYL